MNAKDFSGFFLKILNKKDELIYFDWNPIQMDFHSKRTGRDLVLKSRQVGISTYVQAEIFRSLVTRTTRAATLCHIDSSTQILRQTSDRFYKNFPDNIKEFHKPVRETSNEVMSTYPETDSSHIIGTAGSVNFGRGGSFSIFHGSEVAFWKDAEKIVNGIMQAGDPDIILESSPNGAQGYFYQLCMDSLAGRNDWKLHFYPYTMFPEYQVAGWEEKKRKELGRYFDQEYPSDEVTCFLTSNKGFFSDIDIDWTAPKDTVCQPDHFYSMGVDWGMSGDYTVAIMIDRTDNRMVDYVRFNKMSWNLQRIELLNFYKKWRPQGIRVEANSIGSVNIEELVKDGMDIESFNTTNASKSQVFQRLHEELETGLKLIDWNILRSEMNTMVSKQTSTGLWTISADGDAHDDTLIALALAVSARKGRKQIVYY